ncbi:MAG TPA: hypothetical protein VN692_19335 [Steroidobacteraceae bacterium]|nr:hypothetical protein [Steroidobacteraceae bacterium]
MNKHAFMSAAALLLLLPLSAAADSRMQAASAGSAASATVSVNFKIVIPTVLYLHLGSESAAIMSNNRKTMVQKARCAPAAPNAGRMLCTASMP